MMTLDRASAGWLPVDDRHSIPMEELEIKASRSGGPGGQHVNVTSSRVEVRWNPGRSRVLSAEERMRVTSKLASRLDGEGWMRVTASDTRSQKQNRDHALARLARTVAAALVVPKARKKTRVPRSAREERLKAKKIQSRRKRERGGWSDD